jgi:exodeoxyribonuclease V gamma subunit
LPYSIADQSPANAHHVIEAMLKVLDLTETRFDVESVFELLDYEVIRKRFNLQEHDVVACRELARATNIRWGVSAQSRRKNHLPNTAEHTWRYALNRLLLGYMMPGDQLFTTESEPENNLPLLPFDHIEGSSAQILASLKQFTDILFNLDEWSSQRLNLNDWLQKTRSFITDLFDEGSDYSALLEMLDSLRQQIELAETDTPLPFSVMRKILKKSLLEISANEKYLGYGITFCALVPMRSVPFKVVILLGMNDGDFPRQDTHHSFDLMANKPRKGDRSRRNEDRYLFLESILAARQKLIISFIGQSIKDNSPLPPSVLVSELLDSLNDYISTTDCSEQWITKHPLQSFSPRYFSNDPKLFSYASEYVQLYQQRTSETSSDASPDFIKEPLETLDDQYKQIPVNDLIGFFINPARTFLHKRFSIQTYDNELLLPTREPFELARFDDLKIRDQLLNERYSQSSESSQPIETDDAILVSRAKGFLPYGEIGDQDFLNEKQRIEAFVKQLPAVTPEEKCTVELNIGEFTLTGDIKHLITQPDTHSIEQRIIHTGQAYAKEMITLWLNHLLLNAALDKDVTSYFYSPEQSFSLIPVADAKNLLGQLVQYYWAGLHFPLRFFPKAALKMAEKNSENLSLDIAIKSWENNYFGHSEKDKFENWLLYRNLSHDELFAAEFIDLSKLIFGKLFEAMRTE